MAESGVAGDGGGAARLLAGLAKVGGLRREML